MESAPSNGESNPRSVYPFHSRGSVHNEDKRQGGIESDKLGTVDCRDWGRASGSGMAAQNGYILHYIYSNALNPPLLIVLLVLYLARAWRYRGIASLGLGDSLSQFLLGVQFSLAIFSCFPARSLSQKGGKGLSF